MPRRPDEEGPEPEGGRAAERLRQHLESRYPAGEWPPAPIEDARDAEGEAADEAAEEPGEEAEGEPAEERAPERERPPEQGDQWPATGGEPSEGQWQPEEIEESEDPQQ